MIPFFKIMSSDNKNIVDSQMSFDSVLILWLKYGYFLNVFALFSIPLLESDMYLK